MTKIQSSAFLGDLLMKVKARDPQEAEFHQSIAEVFSSILPVLEVHSEYVSSGILERLVEPERVLMFRVPWVDDAGHVQVNRGYRIEMNSAVGPYKGGLRFHPSVSIGILKFLAFEQVFKNALTTLQMGGGKGGADFDPKGKTDGEVMRFCQSFMTELARHIGPNTDIPGGDIGVGGREIGYLFGQYRRIRNQFNGVLTGKALNWGGSLLRPEATGYGCVYFAREMLAAHSDQLDGKTCLVSGSGNVAQYTLEKLVHLGAKPVTVSDSQGFIYDADGIDQEKIEWIMELKNNRRARISQYVEKFPKAEYVAADPRLPYNPLWSIRADCAFPCATQNEIAAEDATQLIENGIVLVCEGSNMPTTPDAVRIIIEASVLYGPAKAANAGGVATSGLEMAQNRLGLSWARSDIDAQLQAVMKSIHETCYFTAERYGSPNNLLAGANIAAFVRVADAMLDQGVI